MSLLKVEVRRLLSRRLFRVLTILALAGVAAGGIGAYIASDNSGAAIDAAREQRRVDMEACERSFEGAPPGEAPTEEEVADLCAESFASADPRFSYAGMTELIPGLAFAFIMLGWLMGASFIGADWHSRTVTSTLTWEPRRVRVLLTKAVTVALLLFLWVALIELVFAAAMYPAAAFQGTTEGVDRAFWSELLGTILRVAAAASIAGILGFSLATIGRNTAAALGVGFVYLAIVESLIRGLKPTWSSWLIGDNLGAFLVGGGESYTGNTQAEAALYLVGYSGILIAVAVAFFKRREIA